jgi:hypothetical protein
MKMTKYNTNRSAAMMKLGNAVDALGIVDSETGMPPISHKERAVAKLQLLHAQILAKDVLEISKFNNEISKEEILVKLFSSWMENIKKITKETLENDNFSLDIDLLEDFDRHFR